MLNLEKMIQVNLFTKLKQNHRLREKIYGYQGEGWKEGIVREFGMDMDTVIFQMNNQQGPTL